MDTSPTLSISGTRGRAALLTTSSGGTGSADRRVVFLASPPTIGSHDTKTWPHHWSPQTVGNTYRSPEVSPHSEHSRLRMSRMQTDWSEETEDTSTLHRPQNEQTAGPSSRTSPARTATNAEDRASPSNVSCKAGIRRGLYGWRKRCLYSLITSLIVIVVLNLALTIWLLRVMGFNSEGIGSLKVVPGGLVLRGQATVLDTLVASSLRSRRGKNLVLESWNNFTASARAHDGRLLARFTVGEDRVDCVSRGFRITDPRGGVLFSADRERVVVGAEMLRVTGEGGAVFHGSVQTPLVRAESGRDLRLESPTRSLEIRAAQRVVLESWAGDISASCLTDLKLQSVEGALKLEAKTVFLRGLRTATPSAKRQSREQQLQQLQLQRSPRSAGHQGQKDSKIYQLCACASGKLFLAAPEGSCVADKTIC